MQLLRSQFGALVTTTALLLATSVAIVESWGIWQNSLRVHPEWVATKPTLGRGVIGAIAFASGPQAVARNRLDLGAWLGFQEVLSRDALDLARLAARVRVEPGGYVHVLYDVREDGFAGVRLGSGPDAPSLRYRAAPDGEFTEAHPLGSVALEPGTWHELELAFADRAVAATLDGTALGSFPRDPGPQRVGFRGGQRRAEVDDVVLEERGGWVRAETFANRARFAPRLALVAAALAALALAGAALLRRRARQPREIGLALTSASLVLA
ncbi:MAG TPA: hypothetical protein VHQ66_07730, partial [Myxococcota bacterium]|nr:hypothetical protein [Myxococcota bacterium]